jgi:hypothetical protein
MQAIEDSAIVDGDVVGDNLILTRYDTSTINAGNVRGPQGDQGPVGEVSDAEMTAAISAAITTLDSSLPQGLITQAIKTSSQGPLTSIVDISGLSVTFTAVANRNYLLVVEGQYHTTTGNAQVQQFITLSDNTQIRESKLVAWSGWQSTLRTDHIVTPAAGSITYKARVAGSAAISLSASTSTYAFFRVFDVGPA